MSNIVNDIVISGRMKFSCKTFSFIKEGNRSQADNDGLISVYNDYSSTSLCSTPTGNPTALSCL